MNFIELLSLFMLIAAGVVGSWICGKSFNPWGYLYGALLGVALYVAVIAALIHTTEALKSFVTRLPLCRRGKCRTKDYRLISETGNRELECNCGDRYKFSGRTLFYIDARRFIRPYKTRVILWKWKSHAQGATFTAKQNQNQDE